MKKLSLAVMAAGVVCCIANAKEFYGEVDHPVTPFKMALADPIQLPASNYKVYGMRCNIFVGNSFTMRGLDIGLVGMTENTNVGLAINAANWVDGEMCAAQIGAIGNVVNGSSTGFQLSTVVNYNQTLFTGMQGSMINFNGQFKGFQFGLLNWDHGVCYGLELGGVNVNDSELHGWEIGCINYCVNLFGTQIGVVNVMPEKGRGIQIGVFNAATKFQGIQIGLLNVIGDGAVPIFPVINANF
jgi:hypothetical protein